MIFLYHEEHMLFLWVNGSRMITCDFLVVAGSLLLILLCEFCCLRSYTLVSFSLSLSELYFVTMIMNFYEIKISKEV